MADQANKTEAGGAGFEDPEYLAATTLSRRISDGFESLFAGAPDDEVTVGCKDQVEWEVRHVFKAAGISNNPRPDIPTDDLFEFCAAHAGLELMVLHLVDQANMPRINLADLRPHLASPLEDM
jgi:hypothetical protein